VLGGVGQGLGDGEVDGRGHRRGDRPQVGVGAADRDRRRQRGAPRQVAQRGGQAPLGQDGRADAAHRLAQRPQRLLGAVLHGVDVGQQAGAQLAGPPPLVQRLRVQAGDAQGHGQGDEFPLGAVVQVPLDAGALGVEGVDERGAPRRQAADLRRQRLDAFRLPVPGQGLDHARAQDSQSEQQGQGEPQDSDADRSRPPDVPRVRADHVQVAQEDLHRPLGIGDDGQRDQDEGEGSPEEGEEEADRRQQEGAQAQGQVLTPERRCGHAGGQPPSRALAAAPRPAPSRGRRRARGPGDGPLGLGDRRHREVEGQGQGDERDDQRHPRGGAHDLADDEDGAAQVRVDGARSGDGRCGPVSGGAGGLGGGRLGGARLGDVRRHGGDATHRRAPGHWSRHPPGVDRAPPRGCGTGPGASDRAGRRRFP